MVTEKAFALLSSRTQQKSEILVAGLSHSETAGFGSTRSSRDRASTSNTRAACAMKVDYFQAELLPTLKELLPQRPDSIEYALFQALEEAKAPLTTFLDLAPRDGKERHDIESGGRFLRSALRGQFRFLSSGSLPSARGVTLFNANFKRGVLSLAEELNASEHYCARLLEHVLSDATQPVNETTVQNAILSRHSERSAMLASLRLIFETATSADAPRSRVVDFLQKFMFDLIQGPYGGGRDEAPFNLASKLVFEIDAIAAEINGLGAQTTGTPSFHRTKISCLKHILRFRRACPAGDSNPH